MTTLQELHATLLEVRAEYASGRSTVIALQKELKAGEESRKVAHDLAATTLASAQGAELQSKAFQREAEKVIVARDAISAEDGFDIISRVVHGLLVGMAAIARLAVGRGHLIAIRVSLCNWSIDLSD